MFLLWVSRRGGGFLSPLASLPACLSLSFCFSPLTMLGIHHRTLYVVGKYSSTELSLSLDVKATSSHKVTYAGFELAAQAGLKTQNVSHNASVRTTSTLLSLFQP